MELDKMYKGHATVCKDKYILVRGEAPAMLLAHLDTVHRSPVRLLLSKGCSAQRTGLSSL